MSRFVSPDKCRICLLPITHIESCVYMPKLLDTMHRHNTVIMQSDGRCDANHYNENCTVYEQCLICNWLPISNVWCCASEPFVFPNIYMEKVTAICYKCDAAITHIGERRGKLAYIPWHYANGVPHRHDTQYNYAIVTCANGHVETHQIYSTCHCGWTQERKRN